MRLLVAAATTFELDIFTSHLRQHFQEINENHFCKENLEVYICITGIGSMQTVFSLMEAMTIYNPHFCLQAGVAGSFNHETALGSLVIVREEMLGDLGVDDHGRFRDMFEIELMNPNEKPYVKKKLVNMFQDFPMRLNLPYVTGITVNTVSGSNNLIGHRSEYFDCDVETMEGAAFHYVCLKKKVPFLQVRSISNYVEPRDRSKWQMKLAIENLNEWMIANLPES
ncbi:futalosine hydrolase [Taibaiella lutea]|uniref:Futalosine hydrolase n=1 Tax=Taibaiella lutea TaxID=2608001 RepID=A0A5M6CIZ9_9BACT|nr:futalosine hydrolase [Taibaiella lutea]KAA5534993.1 futalosine hydrolase [Taibaiella lutea]